MNDTTPIPAGVLTVDDEPVTLMGVDFYPVRLDGRWLCDVSATTRARLLAAPEPPADAVDYSGLKKCTYAGGCPVLTDGTHRGEPRCDIHRHDLHPPVQPVSEPQPLTEGEQLRHSYTGTVVTFISEREDGMALLEWEGGSRGWRDPKQWERVPQPAAPGPVSVDRADLDAALAGYDGEPVDPDIITRLRTAVEDQ